MGKEKQKAGWRLEGHLPGTLDHDILYTQGEFAEDNFQKLKIQIMSCTLPNQIVCEYADYSTYGHFSATWNAEDNMNQHIRMQHRDSFELQYIAKGTVHGVTEYEAYTLHEGDFRFINRNVLIKLNSNPGSVIVSIHIANEFFRTYFFSENQRFRLKPVPFRDFILPNLTDTQYKNKDYLTFRWKGGSVTESESYQIVQNLYEELKGKKVGFDYITAGLVSRLFASMLDAESYQCERTSIKPQSRDELIVEVKKYLDANRRKVTKKELSGHFHFNEDYIAKLFLAHIGESIRAYNRRICMEEAASLLVNTKLSVDEIVAQLEYAGKAHFYRTFSQYYQMTPTAYRKRHT